MSKPKKFNLKDKLDEDSLDLSVCNLEKIPVKEISEIVKVKRLNLSFNGIISLPVDFIKLQNIRELDLSKNRLKELPDNFGALVNLKSLDLLGNQLASLPSSFCELKSLQWLDLKDNPLNPDLRKAAGECGDDNQCKKCAINVLRYVKEVAADEERKRQIELKKKEQQMKKEAQEKEKEEQLRLLKKQEREQKKLATEKKRRDKPQEEKENSETISDRENDSVIKEKKSQSGKCKSFFSAISFLFVLSMFLVCTYVLLANVCDTKKDYNKQFKNVAAQYNMMQVFQFVDQKVCPHIIRNKLPIENLFKIVQNIYH